jgi:hypothetical protein
MGKVIPLFPILSPGTVVRVDGEHAVVIADTGQPRGLWVLIGGHVQRLHRARARS